MSEPETRSFESVPEPLEFESPYSKDYWDNVFEQVGRRPSVKLALAILALLYGSAIYAPLIANDRPYVLEATDYKDYDRSLKKLYGIALSISDLAKKNEEEFRAGLSAEATIRDYGQALENERAALIECLGSLRTWLPPQELGTLEELEEALGGAVDAALAGDQEAAGRLAGAGRDLAKVVRKDYKAADPADPAAGGKVLVPQRSYPLFEATTSLEVFFMWLWGLLLLWPLWNGLVNRWILASDRDRIRTWRRVKLGAVVGSSLVAAVLWKLLIGGHMEFETAPYKAGLTAGDIVATKAIFPPSSMGFAETHMSERFRPPTWKKNAELDEDGHYMHGARVPEPDKVTGILPPSQPVAVRYAEPDRNSPLRYPLGTDSIGRDLLARILYGGRISLAIGILSTVLLVFIGVVFGSMAGYFGGRTDMLIMRVIEVVQSFPAFFLILTAVSLIPDDKLHPVFAITLLIAVVRWTGVARLVRGEFLRLKEQEFVIAATALGFSHNRVAFRHVLPNAMGPVLVAAAFSVAAGILTESAISFLGLGVKLPIPSWGSLLNEARGVLEYWWLQFFSGFLIFVTVFCYNVVGEGVRDALDPRRKV